MQFIRGLKQRQTGHNFSFIWHLCQKMTTLLISMCKSDTNWRCTKRSCFPFWKLFWIVWPNFKRFYSVFFNWVVCIVRNANAKGIGSGHNSGKVLVMIADKESPISLNNCRPLQDDTALPSDEKILQVVSLQQLSEVRYKLHILFSSKQSYLRSFIPDGCVCYIVKSYLICQW